MALARQFRSTANQEPKTSNKEPAGSAGAPHVRPRHHLDRRHLHHRFRADRHRSLWLRQAALDAEPRVSAAEHVREKFGRCRSHLHRHPRGPARRPTREGQKVLLIDARERRRIRRQPHSRRPECPATPTFRGAPPSRKPIGANPSAPSPSTAAVGYRSAELAEKLMDDERDRRCR